VKNLIATHISHFYEVYTRTQTNLLEMQLFNPSKASGYFMYHLV